MLAFASERTRRGPICCGPGPVRVLAVLALLLAAQAVWAQEEAEKPPARASVIAMATWCTVIDSDQAEDGADDSASGCDLGVAFSLYRHGRWAIVAAIGQDTLGPGLAWIISTPDQPVIGIAVGLSVPYGDEGIGRNPQLTFGATLGIGRPSHGQLTER